MSCKNPRCYCKQPTLYDKTVTQPHDPRTTEWCEWPIYVMDTAGERYCTRGCEFYKEWSECHPYGATTACESLWECEQPDPMKCPYFIDQMNSDEDE